MILSVMEKRQNTSVQLWIYISTGRSTAVWVSEDFAAAIKGWRSPEKPAHGYHVRAIVDQLWKYALELQAVLVITGHLSPTHLHFKPNTNDEQAGYLLHLRGMLMHQLVSTTCERRDVSGTPVYLLQPSSVQHDDPAKPFTRPLPVDLTVTSDGDCASCARFGRHSCMEDLCIRRNIIPPNTCYRPFPKRFRRPYPPRPYF